MQSASRLPMTDQDQIFDRNPILNKLSKIVKIVQYIDAKKSLIVFTYFIL